MGEPHLLDNTLKHETNQSLSTTISPMIELHLQRIKRSDALVKKQDMDRKRICLHLCDLVLITSPK